MNKSILTRLAGVCLAFYSLASQAFTYVPITDDNLLAQSPVVVLGQVQAVAGQRVLNRPVTEYDVHVDQVIKGDVPSSSIVVQTPGARHAAAGAHWLPGMPRLESGDQLLLFLAPREDGSYGLMHLGLGAFRLQQDAMGNRLFVRDLASARRVEVSAPLANAMTEMPREATHFLSQLGAAPETVDSLTTQGHQTGNFTTMGAPPGRWFEFAEARNVPFRAHTGGQPGMTGGGFSQFEQAIAAWVDDPGSNIRYVYAGTTNATTGFRDTDGINTILFDDPNDEVSGTFGCQSGGGVLAAGGFVSSPTSRTYNGQPSSEIIEADIITNDGAGCFFAGRGGSNAAEVFAHELGHTLGLGHSCGDLEVLNVEGILVSDCLVALFGENDALMRAFPHADGRGAALGIDDEAGAAFLYADNGEPPVDDDDTGGSGGGSEGGAGGGSGGGGGGGGGGCVATTEGPFDPLLWLIALLAMAQIRYRRRLH